MVAEALDEQAAFGRQHASFSLAEEHEALFQKAHENLEARVAAEFESHVHGVFATATAHIRSDFLLGTGANDPESRAQEAAAHVEILG